MSGLFITLEGSEGAGKSTQALLLTEALRARGHPVLRTREPGGSPGAERLRTLLLEGDHALSLRAEVMVHFASRVDHVERTIMPALDAGMIVVCDRFYDSTLAYQGYGLGQGDAECLTFIDQLIGLVGLTPDLTLLLDIPRDLALIRLQQRGTLNDRYERLDEPFHQRVADGFCAIALQAAGRVVTIDASGSTQQVHQVMLHEVDQRFPA